LAAASLGELKGLHLAAHNLCLRGDRNRRLIAGRQAIVHFPTRVNAVGRQRHQQEAKPETDRRTFHSKSPVVRWPATWQLAANTMPENPRITNQQTASEGS